MHVRGRLYRVETMDLKESTMKVPYNGFVRTWDTWGTTHFGHIIKIMI